MTRNFSPPGRDDISAVDHNNRGIEFHAVVLKSSLWL